MNIATLFSANPSIISRPDFFSDWDIGGGSEWEHRTRQGSVLKEISVMILLHFCANFVLIYPVWVTGNSPKEWGFFDEMYSPQPGTSTKRMQTEY